MDEKLRFIVEYDERGVAHFKRVPTERSTAMVELVVPGDLPPETVASLLCAALRASMSEREE